MMFLLSCKIKSSERNFQMTLLALAVEISIYQKASKITWKISTVHNYPIQLIFHQLLLLQQHSHLFAQRIEIMINLHRLRKNTCRIKNKLQKLAMKFLNTSNNSCYLIYSLTYPVINLHKIKTLFQLKLK